MTAAAISLTAGIDVPGPAATRRARETALAELTAAGWPTRRREQWRYTDLEPLASARLDLVPSAADTPARDAVARWLADARLGDAKQRLVLLDGRWLPELGGSPAGAEVGDAESRWSEFEARFARAAAATSHPLAALNTAFMPPALWVRIPAGTTAAAPIHVVVAGSARAGLATQPRVVIEVQERAQATVVQHFVDCDGASPGWTNAVTQLALASGARLAFYRFQTHDEQRTHTSLLTAELAAQAELTAGYYDLGGRLVRNDIAIALQGVGARTDLSGVFLPAAGQHIDNHTTIRHAAGETISRESFRGIVGERGRGVFNGRVVVEAGCQRIDAQQSSDNLLLGEHAEIDAKPELEIYANDVKCSHGSTVGELDAEQVFYLTTRGLSAEVARRLLTTAFAAVIVERIGDEAVRNHATERVTARLDRLMEK